MKRISENFISYPLLSILKEDIPSHINLRVNTITIGDLLAFNLPSTPMAPTNAERLDELSGKVDAIIE